MQMRDVPPRIAFALEQAGVHPLLARLLAARGVRQADELDDTLAQLLPPDTLRGADAAARLLADTITQRRRLCVVADYDCDGATACAVLLRGLRLLGAAPDSLHYVVPDRAVHGYGLTPAIVDLALQARPELLITVDNGIASLEGVAHARTLGLKVLVTDHHLPAKDGDRVLLPEADVIVNPNQPGCPLPARRWPAWGWCSTCCWPRVPNCVHAAPSRPRRNRGWMRCSTWSRWAPWPTWSGSMPTTGAWWLRA